MYYYINSDAYPRKLVVYLIETFYLFRQNIISSREHSPLGEASLYGWSPV